MVSIWRARDGYCNARDCCSNSMFLICQEGKKKPAIRGGGERSCGDSGQELPPTFLLWTQQNLQKWQRARVHPLLRKRLPSSQGLSPPGCEKASPIPSLGTAEHHLPVLPRPRPPQDTRLTPSSALLHVQAGPGQNHQNTGAGSISTQTSGLENTLWLPQWLQPESATV